MKPKTEEALKDAIGSAINDNDTFYEDPVTNRCSDNYLPSSRYEETINQAIKNIKELENE